MRAIITDPAAPAGVRLADDLPEPEPGPGEFLLEVRAFAVNSGELRLIGMRPDGWRPGQDVAGVVVRAAADGSGPPVGSRALARVDWEGWAERVPVPIAAAAVFDERVSFADAATLPVAGLTALRALRHGGAVLGRQVLVTGATGGVGHFAVQLAVLSGARVTALVSGAERAGEAAELGAHRVLTALVDDLGAGPFHLVLDGVGGPGLAEALRRTAPGGTAVLYGGPGGVTELRLADFYAQAWNARLIGLISDEPAGTKGEDLAILAQLVAAGRLRPHLGFVEDWTRTADALIALADRRVRGKAVLTRS